ncbi:hypothetical protein A8C32_04330 [Flavivirga aquatica]|uniref:Outer membrane protein beta-barrel domain-containing protein n=1 Tax=Flavivirga aquatica TaxID=1849968 RepID=A0A1E5SH57_9FLAO|nr:porin family protein [Flavivirga aquatica]OEJ98448.1 hypothetical protein A8C32_04330 [Flavivirga aquatica]
MKKLLLSAAVAVLTLTSANAQEVKFGVKAGVNFASIGGDQTSGLDGKTGLHVGGVAEIMFSDKLSLQPELLFSTQGSKFEFDDEFEKEETKTKLNYLNLPVIVKYYVTEGLSIEGGPQIGFLLSAESEYEYTDKEDSEFNEKETTDIKKNVSGLDLGLGFGLGYKLEGGLNFAARYNLGLSNINDFDDSDDFKQQNNVFQVSVGFMF